MYQAFYQGNPWVGFALVGLMLFIAIFSAVTCWAFLPRAKLEFEEAARLPLDP
jgi:cbb3-type cytochrome oxidase subunit 3